MFRSTRDNFFKFTFILTKVIPLSSNKCYVYTTSWYKRISSLSKETFQIDLNNLKEIMKRGHCLIVLGLLISVIGGIALTLSEWVSCKESYPDELLDLGLTCQDPILHGLAPHRNTHPLLILSLRIFYFQRVNLLTTFLRC